MPKLSGLFNLKFTFCVSHLPKLGPCRLPYQHRHHDIPQTQQRSRMTSNITSNTRDTQRFFNIFSVLCIIPESFPVICNRLFCLFYLLCQLGVYKERATSVYPETTVFFLYKKVFHLFALTLITY